MGYRSRLTQKTNDWWWNFVNLKGWNWLIWYRCLGVTVRFDWNKPFGQWGKSRAGMTSFDLHLSLSDMCSLNVLYCCYRCSVPSFPHNGNPFKLFSNGHFKSKNVWRNLENRSVGKPKRYESLMQVENRSFVIMFWTTVCTYNAKICRGIPWYLGGS